MRLPYSSVYTTFCLHSARSKRLCFSRMDCSVSFMWRLFNIGARGYDRTGACPLKENLRLPSPSTFVLLNPGPLRYILSVCIDANTQTFVLLNSD
ncbi:hypothetical protein P691DRAFT_305709 [Macrolepiota fuliginosa MF-IS2]|uniref:Uncharacterized protein n=1 Tax=Macrolepiota fuliginosa MF-IS2 TaxID=1400762 RepID=A0A9P6C0P7_9AGAR|nr:hypothetical protein P691DRAFT_305709 [Macrolepiota fuliginosa MF-IS2]